MQDIDIIVTYSDISGDVRIRSVKSKDLSASWVWKDPIDDHTQGSKVYINHQYVDAESSYLLYSWYAGRSVEL